MRDKVDTRYFKMSDIIATDDSINKNDFPEKTNFLDLNNPEEIVNWIKENGERV